MQTREPDFNRPSCLTEFILIMMLGGVFLIGSLALIGPFLSNSLGSLGGMGLK